VRSSGESTVKKARARSPARSINRRGSPEVVEKRRAARAFNEALLGNGAPARDGRTERRRQRLLKELAEGFSGSTRRELKPIDVLARVAELLDLGEPLASIRKAYPPRKPIELSAEILETVRRIHKAYGFPLEAYRFVGLDEQALRTAGIRPWRPGLVGARPSARAARRGAA
jgi:hypothetical protein